MGHIGPSGRVVGAVAVSAGVQVTGQWSRNTEVDVLSWRFWEQEVSFPVTSLLSGPKACLRCLVLRVSV